MKKQTEKLEQAFWDMTSAMKGLTLGPKQSSQIAEMIEDFLIELRQHIDNKEDVNGVYRWHRAHSMLEKVQGSIGVDLAPQIDDAYDRAMKSVTKPGDLKFTEIK